MREVSSRAICIIPRLSRLSLRAFWVGVKRGKRLTRFKSLDKGLNHLSVWSSGLSRRAFLPHDCKRPNYQTVCVSVCVCHRFYGVCQCAQLVLVCSEVSIRSVAIGALLIDNYFSILTNLQFQYFLISVHIVDNRQNFTGGKLTNKIRIMKYKKMLGVVKSNQLEL